MTKEKRQNASDVINLLDEDVKLESDILMDCDDDYDDYEDFEDYDYEDEDIYDFSKPESSAGSWTSLILGIIASLGWMMPIVGLPVTIVGTVFGAINMKSKKHRGIAIAGFVVNIVFLCASIAKGVIDIIRYVKHHK